MAVTTNMHLSKLFRIGKILTLTTYTSIIFLPDGFENILSGYWTKETKKNLVSMLSVENR